MKDLTLVKRAPFGAMTVDYYGDGRGNFYMTREQIGRALGYSNPQIAIHKIHRRYKARMDEFSLTKMVNGREVFFYSAKGVYEICRHSDMPVADAFYDAVYEVLEGKRPEKPKGIPSPALSNTPRPKAARTRNVIMSICRGWQMRRQGSPTGTKPTRANLLCFSFRKPLLTLRCARAWKREDTTKILQGLRGSGYITLPPSLD